MKNHFLYTEGGGFNPVKVANPEEVEFLVIDLFCGAGGTSTGFSLAKLGQKQIALVIACVNHDPKAIKSHWLNHPETLHFEEDIRTLDLTPLVELLAKYRILYPNAKVILWASLECTNYSKAKGGQSRDADSRTLAKHLDRYVIALNPDYIQIENVVEFMSWGPLRIACKKKHKNYSELKIVWNKYKEKEDYSWIPESKKNGQDWLRWKSHINSFGYRDEWREINSADFGAYTSRNRLFGCFAKPDLPIVWPTATHSKKPVNNGLFGSMEKWKPVKDVLDFSDEGKSIFKRKKNLSDKTLEVIYKGLIKSIAENETSFLVKYYGNTDNSNSVNEPAGTITTKDRFAMVQILRNYKSGFTTSVNKPIGTLPTVPKAYLLSFIFNPSHGGHTTSVSQPCPVIIARQDKAPLYLIKALMNENGLADITMRMLKVPELLLIQGFPQDYKLFGNQKDQKKFIGNSVHPFVPKFWAEALALKIMSIKVNAA